MNHYQSFIKHFNGLLTFQLFPERKKGKPFHFTRSADDASRKLLEKNRDGMGVFLMVNEGDGFGRKASNVKRVRAVFADLDSVSLDHAFQALSKKEGILNLHPHLIINTSPDKYHIYWFVDDFPVDKFKLVQQAIAQKIGSDKAVCDLGRVMRVAGFFHTKKDPYPVKITNMMDLPHYSYEQIIEEFPLPEVKSRPIFRRKVQSKVVGNVDFKKLDVVSWFQSHGLYHEYLESNIHAVECPWSDEHTSKSRAETVIFHPQNDWAGFHCKHNSCQGRNIQQVAALLGDAGDFVR